MDDKAKMMIGVLTVLVGLVLYFVFFSGKKISNFGKAVNYTDTEIKSGHFGEQVPSGLEKSVVRGEYIWKKDDSVMVFVPAGYFTIGSAEIDEAKPARKIEISSYYIDKYEVTVSQYKSYVKATGKKMASQPTWSSNYHPVVFVSWQNANDYAQWADKRLPTEAEWEKAARGGEKIPQWGGNKIPIAQLDNNMPDRKYSWGNAQPNVAGSYRCNYKADNDNNTRGKDGYDKASPVGSFRYHEGSIYGCCDLIGNVREWCYDYYKYRYDHLTPKNPAGEKEGVFKVIRGGSWNYNADKCRVAAREGDRPERSYEDLGFRLVKSQRTKK